MKKALLVALLAALAGVAFWISRQTDDDPAPAPVAVTPVVERPAGSVAARPKLARPPAQIAADLTSLDAKVRRSAVREAARNEDARALLAAARDADLGVARTAIGVLNKLAASGKVELRDMISLATDRSMNDGSRGLAINGVGAIKHPDAAAMLIEMLATGTELERRSAATLLARQEPEVAVPPLITALSDRDELVRTQAVESLKVLSGGSDFGTDAGRWRAWWQSRR